MESTSSALLKEAILSLNRIASNSSALTDLPNSPSPFIEFLIAIFGPLFATLLSATLIYFFSRYNQRRLLQFNALVKLETQLQDTIGTLDINLFLIPNFIKVIKAGHLYFNKLHEIPLDKSHLEQLHDLKLINTVYMYLIDLERLNYDIRNLNTGYEKISGVFIASRNTAEYNSNVTNLASDLEKIGKFHEHTINKTVRMTAITRLALERDKPFIVKCIHKLIKSTMDKFNDQDIDKEVEKVNREMEEVRSESKKEIDSIYGTNEQPKL